LLTNEFGRTHHDRIHFTTQRSPRRMQHPHDFSERCVAEHHDVHVAVGLGFARSHGPEHKSEMYLRTQGEQRVSERLYKPCCLAQEPCKVLKHGGVRVGGVENLPACLPSAQEAEVGQCLQLAMQSARRNAGDTSQFPYMQRLVRPQ
jgi:hypothetical protein